MDNILKLKPKVIELFAGAGGMTLGAIRAGFDVVLMVDIDKHCIETHKQNFTKAKHLDADVLTLTPDILYAQAGLKKGELCGLIGGPPCQGFSTIGKGDVEDPRNILFVRFFKLISECKPHFFVVENVPGILNDKYNKIRETALEYVKGKYVMLEPLRLKANDYGAATSRERIFFIGYKRAYINELTVKDFNDKKLTRKTKIKNALSGLPQKINNNWDKDSEVFKKTKRMGSSFYAKSIAGRIPDGVGDEVFVKHYKEERIITGCIGTKHSKAIIKRYGMLKPGEVDEISRSVKLDMNSFCPTLRAGTGTDHGSFQAVRPIHPTQPRVITPREAARLQGFPDWFQFPKTKWHSFRQIGNSISPFVSEAVFAAINKALLVSKFKE